jgi:hypothetical protein
MDLQRCLSVLLVIMVTTAVQFTSLRTGGDFCQQGRDTEFAPKYLRLSKSTET